MLKFVRTYDDDVNAQNSTDFLEPSAFQIAWQRRGQEGLTYLASLSRAGEDYLPEMGFTTRRDFTEYVGAVNYSWFPGEKSPFRQISPIQCFGFVALRNGDGSMESAQLEYDTDLTWKSGANVWSDFEIYFEDVRETLSFPDDTEIPQGDYTYYKWEGGYNMARGRILRTNISFGYGTFYDGRRGEIGSTTIWNASRHFELSLQYRGNFVRFPDRDQEFDSHIVRLRIRTAFDRKVSINGFIQYNSIGDIFLPNIRLRYNFREGNDLWIVYNEEFNTDRRKYDPVLPTSNNRAILVKYTHTFRM
jgi:hypothetical protein